MLKAFQKQKKKKNGKMKDLHSCSLISETILTYFENHFGSKLLVKQVNPLENTVKLCNTFATAQFKILIILLFFLFGSFSCESGIRDFFT